MNQHRQMNYTSSYTTEQAQQSFLKHAALAEHFKRLKFAHANDHSSYYRYAELQYYHKSRSIHFKGYFSAASF